MSYMETPDTGTVKAAKMASVMALLSFLFGCASTPQPSVNKTEKIQNCVHTISETKKIATGEKIKDEDGREIDEEKILSHIEEAKWVDRCADYGLLVTLLKVDMEQARISGKPPEDATLMISVLLGLASLNEDVTLFVERALKEQEITEEQIWDNLSAYYKHKARIRIAGAASNLKNQDNTWNLKEMAFLWESWNGDNGGKGKAFEHVPAEFVREAIQKALSERKPSISIDEVYDTLKQKTPKGEFFRCSSEQTMEYTNDSGQKVRVFSLCDKQHSHVFPPALQQGRALHLGMF